MMTETAKDTNYVKPHLKSSRYVPKWNYWDSVNGSELSATEVRKVRQPEGEYLNKRRVVERVPHSTVKARACQEPVKVRWVDTLKDIGVHRSRLVAKDYRRGATLEGFTNFSATAPLELVKLTISLVAIAQCDRAAWFGHESSAEILRMHTDISRAYFHAPSKEENTSKCRLRRGAVELPSVHRDAAAHWEFANCKVLHERQFARGMGCPCSSDPREP